MTLTEYQFEFLRILQLKDFTAENAFEIAMQNSNLFDKWDTFNNTLYSCVDKGLATYEYTVTSKGKKLYDKQRKENQLLKGAQKSKAFQEKYWWAWPIVGAIAGILIERYVLSEKQQGNQEDKQQSPNVQHTPAEHRPKAE